MRRVLVFLLFGLVFGTVLAPRPVTACGGLFCQNSPVEQNAERIIFTQNQDGTISAIIQIQYTGFAEDFSWILPLPTPITADQVQSPEGASDAFLELELQTNPRFIRPDRPLCAQTIGLMSPAQESASDDVSVFASGTAGPFSFDVIGSEDPAALITWLRDNEYRVEEPMEPLINVYVEEQFVFLAMKLLPDQGVQDIQPIKVTYETDEPMIPLRLTAVAANPNMAVLTWFFADEQAVPANYGHMELNYRDVTFWDWGGNNYRQLVIDGADEFENGQAFITEYAQPITPGQFSNEFLAELASDYDYLTRLNTYISPEEMTVDPVFRFEAGRENVSNVHDLSDMRGLWACQRSGENFFIHAVIWFCLLSPFVVMGLIVWFVVRRRRANAIV